MERCIREHLHCDLLSREQGRVSREYHPSILFKAGASKLIDLLPTYFACTLLHTVLGSIMLNGGSGNDTKWYKLQLLGV